MRKFLLFILMLPLFTNAQNAGGYGIVSTTHANGGLVSQKKIVGKSLTTAKQTDKVTRWITDTQVTFFDSFENFNATTLVPDGWASTNKLPSSRSWKASEAISMLGTIEPTDGDYMMWINFDTDLLDQDSWLVSPNIMPNLGDSLEFDIYYAPIFMYYKYDEISGGFYLDFSSPTATMKVLIADAGSENWTVLWDAHDLAGKYNEDNIYDYMGEWERHKVSLEDHVFKTVKIAFQYVGNNGDSMAADCLWIGQGRDVSGVEQLRTEEVLSVYRSGGLIHMVYPVGFTKATVTDLSGRIVGAYALNSDGNMQVDAAHLADKVYIFRFEGDGKTVTKKMLNSY